MEPGSLSRRLMNVKAKTFRNVPQIDTYKSSSVRMKYFIYTKQFV